MRRGISDLQPRLQMFLLPYTSGTLQPARCQNTFTANASGLFLSTIACRAFLQQLATSRLTPNRFDEQTTGGATYSKSSIADATAKWARDYGKCGEHFASWNLLTSSNVFSIRFLREICHSTHLRISVSIEFLISISLCG